MDSSATILKLDATAYTIPTDGPESDGTIAWDSTTLVLVEATAGGQTGLGYTYAAPATAGVIAGTLQKEVLNRPAMDVPGAWEAMVRSVRNLGRPGVASCAISAVDTALWDLKAKLLNLPLASLFGQAQEAVNLYGSGGFTSYTDARLRDQLSGWVQQGIGRVKMKIGRDPVSDPARVRAARDAIGDAAELFVDANGAYDRKQAIRLAGIFAEESNVTWFEQPVYHFDLDGLRLVRDRAPMEVTSGEYGYTPFDFRRILDAGAVDVLQIDATRCGGYSGFLKAAALGDAHSMPMSSHCAPALHLPVCAALAGVRHMEYFFDHARIERMLFEGVPDPVGGALRPDLSRPGHGLAFKKQDAEPFRAS